MSNAKLHTQVKRHLEPLGFMTGKHFVYYRMAGPVIEYIALSRQRSPGEFDLGCGIRAPGSTFPATALIGPMSGVVDQVLAGRTYFKARICFMRNSPTIDECADRILGLTEQHLLPWFAQQQQALSEDPFASALIDQDKAMWGTTAFATISPETNEALGIKPNNAMHATSA